MIKRRSGYDIYVFSSLEKTFKRAFLSKQLTNTVVDFPARASKICDDGTGVPADTGNLCCAELPADHHLPIKRHGNNSSIRLIG